MAYTVDCGECDEQMVLSVQPPERRRPLPKGDRPTMLSTTIDEWRCPNGHYRDATHTERRMFE